MNELLCCQVMNKRSRQQREVRMVNLLLNEALAEIHSRSRIKPNDCEQVLLFRTALLRLHPSARSKTMRKQRVNKPRGVECWLLVTNRGQERKPRKWLFACLLMLSFVTIAWADDPTQAKTPDNLPWWQVVTGIVGIPTAILGGYLVWKQIKKTGIEIKNMQKEKPPENPKGGQIKVANRSIFKGSNVGDISGIMSSTASAQLVDQYIEVLNDAMLGGAGGRGGGGGGGAGGRGGAGARQE